MSKIYTIALILLLTYSSDAQVTSRFLNIMKGGSVIYQYSIDGIDSVVFSSSSLATLVTPANGDTGVFYYPTLSWNSTPGATSYFLVVATDSLLSNVVFSQSGLTNTSQGLPELTLGTKYFWRVTASLPVGALVSQIQNFRIKTTASITCGQSFTYSGKVYHTVQIGTQCWMQENLNVGTMINSTQTPTNNDIAEKYCYQDIPSNCETYGGLYRFYEATYYSNNATERGICPLGTRLPTSTELWDLRNFVDGDHLAVISAVDGGNNSTGFSALLGGIKEQYMGYIEKGVSTGLWYSGQLDPDEGSGYISISFGVPPFEPGGITGVGTNAIHSLSVRCIVIN